MSRSLKAGLFLSSLLALLAGCAPLRGYQKIKTIGTAEGVVQPVTSDSAQLYRAEIDVLNKHFSGLLLVKSTTDSTTHLTFVSEVGMTIFDFRVVNKTIELVSILDPLNKASLVAVLKQELSRLILLDLFVYPSEYFRNGDKTALRQKNKYRSYYFADRHGRAERIIIKGWLFRKALITYQYSDQYEQPSRLELKRSGTFPLRINLNRITKK